MSLPVMTSVTLCQHSFRLLGDWKALAWWWIVCCTGDRSAWKGHWLHPPLVSAAPLQVLWPGFCLGEGEMTGLCRTGPVGAPKCDWNGDSGGGLKTIPGGQVGVSWQEILVWGQNGPCVWRFHSPGLDLSSGQISVKRQRKIDSNIKNTRKQNATFWIEHIKKSYPVCQNTFIGAEIPNGAIDHGQMILRDSWNLTVAAGKCSTCVKIKNMFKQKY